MREMYDFDGEHRCNLCPKKIILNDRDLKLHLESKSHQKKVIEHYKKNRKEVVRRLKQIGAKSVKESLFSTGKYQRLLRLGFHTKVKVSMEPFKG